MRYLQRFPVNLNGAVLDRTRAEWVCDCITELMATWPRLTIRKAKYVACLLYIDAITGDTFDQSPRTAVAQEIFEWRFSPLFTKHKEK